MSLTQERINEIILKRFHEMKQFEYVSDRVILVTVNNVLSRIREEQEAVGEAVNVQGSNGELTIAHFYSKDVPAGTKLFTIPPAAPESTCAELVEALERCHIWLQGSEPHRAKYVGEIISKHKASMGEK